MDRFQEFQKQNKPLPYVTGIVYLYPQLNGYGREVGKHEVTLESQVISSRRHVFQMIHEARENRRVGRHHRTEEYKKAIRISLKLYRKYWREYLRALRKAQANGV